MGNKKSVNRGLQIGTQNNYGGNVSNVGGDMIINNNATGISQESLIALLQQISEMVESENIAKDIKQTIRGDLQSALQQTQSEQPQKGLLIINRLKSISELIVSLGGAISAGQTIYPLLQKAIEFAQKLFVG